MKKITLVIGVGLLLAVALILSKSDRVQATTVHTIVGNFSDGASVESITDGISTIYQITQRTGGHCYAVGSSNGGSGSVSCTNQ